MAKKLKAVVDAAVLALEAEKATLPASVTTISPTKVRNPFA